MRQKEQLTLKIWKKSLRRLSKEVYVMKFFMYLDCLQYFQCDNDLYIYTYNFYMYRIIKKHYLNKLKEIIFKTTKHNYNIIFKVGLISLDWDKRIIIKREEIIQIQVEDINRQLKINLLNNKIRIIYINAEENKIRIIIEKYILKLKGINFYITNIKDLLNSSFQKIAILHEYYDVFILIEKNHNYEFQKLLIKDNNIDKIHLIMLKKKIIIISNIDLIILENRLMRFMKNANTNKKYYSK